MSRARMAVAAGRLVAILCALAVVPRAHAYTVSVDAPGAAPIEVSLGFTASGTCTNGGVIDDDGWVWSTPDSDGIPLSGSVASTEDFLWAVQGTKTVMVSNTGCPSDPPAMTTVEINGCEIDQATYTVAESAGSSSFDIVRVNGSVGELACSIFSVSGTATPGMFGDFEVGGPSFVTFSDGDATPITIPFTIDDDAAFEGNEQGGFELDGTVPMRPEPGSMTAAEWQVLRSQTLQTLRSGGSPLRPRRRALGQPADALLDAATLVILDNDGEITITGDSVNEGDSSPVSLSFTIEVLADGSPTSPESTNVTVEFSTATLDAISGVDFTAISGQVVTFTPSGSTSQVVDVDVLPDTIFELSEDFTGNLANATGAVITTASANGTILDNDAPPTITVDPASVLEGDSGTTTLSFPFSLDVPAGFETQIDFSTIDQTALAGSDYVGVNGDFVLVPAGTTSGTIDITVNGDTVNEGDETFLLDALNEDFSYSDQIVGTITGDDFPGFEIDDAQVTEGDAGTATLTFNVTLTSAAFQNVSVDVATAAGSAEAGSDFMAFSAQTVNFLAGETTMPVEVTVFGDGVTEVDETFVVNLSNATANFPILDAQGVGTIVNDDATFAFGGSGTASEGGGVIEVILNKVGFSSTPVNLELSVSGTATPGGDYDPSAIPSNVLFTPSDDQISFQIPLVDDTEQEDDETIIITADLAAVAPSKPEIKTSAALSGLPVTITLILVDNETTAGSTLAFDRSSYSEFEDAGEVVVTVERSGDTSFPVSVDLFAIDGEAVATEDYVFSTQTVSWGANEGDPREVTIDLVSDTVIEPDESFTLELRRPRSATGGLVSLGTIDTAAVTIRQRDFVQFSEISYVGLEGGAPVNVQIERVGSPAEAFAVEVCEVSGSATPADFNLSPISFTWLANDGTSRDLQVRIVDDALTESLETVEIELCNPSVGTEIAGNSRTVIGILDNDIGQSAEEPVTSAENGPEGPIVVYGPAGQRLVVWQELDGDGFGIFARLFGPSGAALGETFRVNSSIAGNQLSPAAAFDGLGNFIVVWRELVGDSILQPDGRIAMASLANTALVGAFFDPTGTAQTETVIATGDDEDVQSPDVAADENGNVVVTWDDGGDIKGRVVDGSGGVLTPEIIISRLPNSANPQIAISASGDFIVVWEEGAGALRAEAGARLNGSALVAQVFTEFGQTKSEPVQVNDGQQTAFSPAVAADDDGNFIVVWEEETVDDLDIFGRLFSKSGEARTPRLAINDGTSGSQTNPRVDANSIGDFAIVWESSPTSVPAASSANGGSLVGRFFSPLGEAQTADVAVASTVDGSQPLAPDVSIDDDDETTVVFERRGPGGAPEGVFETTFSPEIAPFVCASDATGVCLNNQRFRVTAGWQDFEGTNGDGQAVGLTSDTGYFWFFDEANVEVVVKVLDACAVNNHYWVFAAGLTNTEVNLQVDDSVAGLSKTYFNRLNNDFTPVLDTSAFATCDVSGRPEETAAEGLERLSDELRSAQRAAAELGLTASSSESSEAVCASSDTSLCLNQNRFEAAVSWQTSQGTSGDGQAVGLTSDTGYFWFFDEQNVELVVKVLDACDVFGRYWVFAAGLTDVGAQLSVVDSANNASRSYENPLGTAFTPVIDTDAFACP
ncbi:MAG: Calx-beta domain-containing protein [Acidobacteriota bacterium]